MHSRTSARRSQTDARRRVFQRLWRYPLNSPPLAARTAIALLLKSVVHEGASLTRAAPSILDRIVDSRDRAFAQACVYGVLRHYFSLRDTLGAYLKRPLRARDADIEMVLLSSLFQIHHMRVPDHAAVSGAVEAARALRKKWATGLVNGVLRSSLREPRLTEAPKRHHEHPDWLAGRICADWPEDCSSILEANNEQGPLSLRLDLSRVSREQFLEQLADLAIPARPGRHAKGCVVLDETRAVTAIPGFDAGQVSVQDEAAQLAAVLLAPAPGMRVLDACAAPGGKTAGLLERLDGSGFLLALDRDNDRLADLRGTLSRLRRACEIINADAALPEDWWDGVPFDRILVDAPCSAVGVIRRHPDIRFHRQPADIESLVATQSRLLVALWPLLRPGGSLLYATCSYLRAENDDVIDGFLATSSDAQAARLDHSWGVATRHGRQILPGMDAMDGFYYARLDKRADAP